MPRSRRSAVSAPHVLISEGGSGESRAALAAVRALARGGYRPSVTVSGDLSLAGASRHCERRIPVPSVEDDAAGYAAAIRTACAAQRYVTIFPASDPALLALGAPVRHLLDKVACAEGARAAGLATPPSEVFDSAAEVIAAAARLPYPVIAKPDIKRFLAVRADSREVLERLLAPQVEHPGRVIVQPYLGDALHGVVGVAWRGRLVECMHMRYHRLWPLPCGTVAAATTVAADPELEERLMVLLGDYDGVFHADLAGPYLLDLNPRIHATLPLALAAGLNPAARYCDLLLGRSVAAARARPNLFFRWLEGDVRSVLRGVRTGALSAGSALRALAPRRDAVHSIESWSDPSPSLARLRYMGRRLRRGRNGSGAPARPGAALPA